MQIPKVSSAFQYIDSITAQLIDLTDNEDIGLHIKHTGGIEPLKEVAESLSTTIMDFMYEGSQFEKQIQRYITAPYSYTREQAVVKIFKECAKQFRVNFIQGQVGELLLFSILCNFFQAAPLLRKKVLSTSAEMEIFGVDAAHIRVDAAETILYLGESKAYNRGSGLRHALRNSVLSILDMYESHRSELSGWCIHDAIFGEHLELAHRIKSAQEDYNVKLICSVICEYDPAIDGRPTNDQIKRMLLDQIKSQSPNKIGRLQEEDKSKLHFVVFLVNDIHEFCKKFAEEIS